MKKLMISLLIIVLAMGSMVFAFADGGADEVVAGQSYSLEEMLQYAYEDESKALAEYDAIMEKFGVQAPFVNIKKAEENHLAAVERLYNYFGLEVPEFEFELPQLPETLEETYAIGVEAEIDNIAMYESFLEDEELDPRVAGVFTSLMNGSKQHQAAFERAGECESEEGMQQKNNMRQASESMNGLGRKGSGQGIENRQGNRSYGRENGLQGVNIQNKRMQTMDPENCPNI